MAEAATKLPVRTEEKKTDRPTEWRPFESLRREVERLFDDFQVGSWRSPFGRTVFDVEPFRRSEIGWGKAPAVDIVDKNKAYEITAELPGLDENNIDVKFADGTVTIKGEKRDEKGGEEEGLLSVGASLRLVPAFVWRTGRRRRRQDRSDLQERRAHGHLAQDRRGAEKREENCHQQGLRPVARFLVLAEKPTGRGAAFNAGAAPDLQRGRGRQSCPTEATKICRWRCRRTFRRMPRNS